MIGGILAETRTGQPPAFAGVPVGFVDSRTRFTTGFVGLSRHYIANRRFLYCNQSCVRLTPHAEAERASRMNAALDLHRKSIRPHHGHEPFVNVLTAGIGAPHHHCYRILMMEQCAPPARLVVFGNGRPRPEVARTTTPRHQQSR